MGTAILLFIFIGLFFGVRTALFPKNNNRNNDSKSFWVEGVPPMPISGQVDENGNPLKVTISEEQININNIPDYVGEDANRFIFDPQNFQEFIGQERIKEQVNVAIEQIKSKKGRPVHFFVSGIRGHGKTTLIHIIAKMLDAELIEYTGKHLNMKTLEEALIKINSSKKEHVIFFADEIDVVKSAVVKSLNSIIYNFQVGGTKKLKPFIFASATIKPQELIVNNPDTLERITEHLKMEHYTVNELIRILKQYQKQMYDEQIEEKVYKKLAENCRLSPRVAQTLMDNYMILKDVEKVLDNKGIIVNGLTHIDLKLLNELNKSEKGMGAEALAQKLRMSKKEYEVEYEPFLVLMGYIDRRHRRIIGEEGKKLLEELKRRNVS